MHRFCVYAKDIAMIIGKTPETGNKILREIRRLHNKKKSSPITIYELAEYLEMDVELIKNTIQEMDHWRGGRNITGKGM